MAKAKKRGETSKRQPDPAEEPDGSLSKGGPMPDVADSDPKKPGFLPVVLDKTVITAPLFDEFKKKERIFFPVIIDVNLLYYEGREQAKAEVQRMIITVLDNLYGDKKEEQGFNILKTKFSQQYVFARLTEEAIKALVVHDAGPKEGAETKEDPSRPESKFRAIYHIWPDFPIQKLTNRSISTVKADAARNAFSALGHDIYWAVMDSGIDATHPHFDLHKNLELPTGPDPLQHRDFTIISTELSTNLEDITRSINMKPNPLERPLEDRLGHGTHVAGIIAGEFIKGHRSTSHALEPGTEGQQAADAVENEKIIAISSHRDENNQKTDQSKELDDRISGMAPKCKLVSLKVLDDEGLGAASNLIAAIQWIQEVNGYGRRIRIHGVNMSVGYEFDPQWFACGQSPLCVEVDRLVKSGVAVVVAAGNTGYGFVQAEGKRYGVTAGLDLTINDPGNADLAITVGATHRDMPHIYGVSYFSSKGPTGDGRLKPDLVAPGEKILSCDSKHRRERDEEVRKMKGEESLTETLSAAATGRIGYYREDSGTSMAAPHVSGVIAAFLSVRREFIGKPEAVKEIFLNTATDLKRERYFQGRGLVDLMRAIQSV